jgi:hypothetical protein
MNIVRIEQEEYWEENRRYIGNGRGGRIEEKMMCIPNRNGMRGG